MLYAQVNAANNMPNENKGNIKIGKIIKRIRSNPFMGLAIRLTTRVVAVLIWVVTMKYLGSYPHFFFLMISPYRILSSQSIGIVGITLGRQMKILVHSTRLPNFL